jgi:hypothetical protein
MNNITPNELKVLLTIINNDYQTFDKSDRDLIKSATWTFVCEDSGIKGKSLSGTISSLTQKGLVGSTGAGNDSTIWITEAGYNGLNN